MKSGFSLCEDKDRLLMDEVELVIKTELEAKNCEADKMFFSESYSEYLELSRHEDPQRLDKFQAEEESEH